MADAVVDRLEVVQVEDDQRQAAVVALRSCHLARQGLVEVAAVVEPGQGVEVGELPRLAEAAGVLDRGAGTPGQLLELPDHAFLEAERGRAAVDRDEPDRSGLAGSGHGQAGMHELLAFQRRRVLVGDRDRARLVPVGRAGDRLTLRLYVGEALRGDDRLVVGVDRNERRVGARDRTSGLEGARQHLLEVDRAPELVQEAVSPALLLHPLKGAGQVLNHRLHAGVQLGDEGDDVLLAAPAPPSPRDGDEPDERERRQRRADSDDDGGSRQHLADHLPRLVLRPARREP